MVTDVPPQVGSARNGRMGLFAFMGYHVRAGGPNKDQRQAVLEKMYEEDFRVQQGSQNSSYVSEFGLPGSKDRFEKMIRFLDTNLKIFGGQVSPNWQSCLDKWREDRDWFADEFG